MPIRDIIGDEMPPDTGPLQVGIPPRRALPNVRGALASLQQGGGGDQSANAGNGNTLAALHELMQVPAAPADPNATSGAKGYYHVVGGAEAGLGADVASAGQYLTSKLPANGILGPVAGAVFGKARQWLAQKSQDHYAALTPLEQQEIQRSVVTLDPHKTIFQGGAAQTAHALTLQAANQLPGFAATMLPAGWLIKAGLKGGALVYIGATQAGLSMGQISQNVADEINNRSDQDLFQHSEFFYNLVEHGTDPASARQQLIQKAQGLSPLIGGAVAGTVSMLAGRYIEPVLMGGGGLANRAVGGAAVQATMGAGTRSAEQVAKDVAAQTYDNRAQGPSVGNTLQAAGQGLGGDILLGGGFGAMMGHGPQQEAHQPASEPSGVPQETHTSGPEDHKVEPLGNTADSLRQPARPVYRGSDVENPVTGQQHLDFGVDPNGVNQDQALAVRSHFADANPQAVAAAAGQGDLFNGMPEQAPRPGMAGPAGTDMSQVHARMDQLPLQGGQMNPTAGPDGFARMSPSREVVVAPNQNQQLELPFRAPRGGGGPPDEGGGGAGGLARMPTPERSQVPQDQQSLFPEANLPEHPDVAAERALERGQIEAQSAASKATEQEFGKQAASPLAQRGLAAATGGEETPTSKAEVANRLIDEARQLRTEEKGRAQWESTNAEIVHPSDLHWSSKALADRYENLYNQYAGAEILARQAGSPEELTKARAHQEKLERKLLGMVADAGGYETNVVGSKRLAKVAAGVDYEALRQRASEENQPNRGFTEVNPGAFEPTEALSPRDVRMLDAEEVKDRFMHEARIEAGRTGALEVAAHEPTPEESRSAGLVQRRVKEAEGRGTTVAELQRRFPTTSEQRKYLNRVYAERARQEALGNVNAKTKSKPIASSPRTALSAEERQRNRVLRGLSPEERAKFAEHGVSTEIKTPNRELPVNNILQTQAPNVALEEAMKKRETREVKRTQLLSKVSATIERSERSHAELARVRGTNFIEGSPASARAYMRELLQYGRILRDSGLRSADNLFAADRYITEMAKINRLAPGARAKYLIEVRKAELKSQDYQASGATPSRSGERPRLSELEAQRRARHERPEARVVPRSEETMASVAAEAQAPPNTLSRGEQTGMKMQLGTGRSPTSPTAIVEGLRAAGEHVPAELARAVDRGQGTESQLLHRILQYAESRGHSMLAYREKGGVKFVDLQEAAIKAMDAETAARQDTGENYVLQDSTAGLPKTQAAAAEIGRILENGPASLKQLYDVLLKHLPADHPFVDAIKTLRDNGINAPVRWAPTPADAGERLVMGNTHTTEEGHRIALYRDSFETLRSRGTDPSTELVHTLLHEAFHVATLKGIATNAAARAEIETMINIARGRMEMHYGLSNPMEFVSEVMSNSAFRRDLASIRVPGGERTLMQQFVDFVRRMVGLPATDRSVSLLEKALNVSHSLVSPEHLDAADASKLRDIRNRWAGKTAGAKKAAAMGLDHNSELNVGNLLDRGMKSAKLETEVRDRVADAGESVANRALSLTSPRQMVAAFSKYFENAKTGENPFKQYWDTFFQRNADNNAMMEKVGRTSNTWSNLSERHGADTARKFSTMLHDATLYGIHPDVPADVEANKHLAGKGLLRHEELSHVYDSLPEDYKQHYQVLKKYYATMQRDALNQIIYNELHVKLTTGSDAVMTPKEFEAKYSPDDITRKGLDNELGLQKEFGDKIDPETAGLIDRLGSYVGKQKGPYFPLIRNGDFVVSAKRLVETKTFQDGPSARAYIAAQRADDPTLSIPAAPSKNADGSYTVSVHEREVRMAESKAAARVHQQELVKRYGQENVQPIRLKADLYKPKADITTGSALDRILNDLAGNPAAQAAIKDFYLRSLAEQSFRKRELNRSNVRGVEPENQHRSFVQYGRSASYYLSQLRYGRTLANTLGQVHEMVGKHTDESQVSATRLGAIAKEIQHRDEIARTPPQVSKVAQATTNFTQFAMMTSVSHWFVRGSQPYMLSVPWLAARHGLGESMAAMVHAQGLIASPLLKEGAASGMGLRTLFARNAARARTSAEQTYSVLDQLSDHVLQSNAPRAKEYVAMLKALRANGVIDMSMATEMRDIAQGQEKSTTARILDASRAGLHLVEVNNRAMTSIAAYELARAKGATVQAATDHALDCVATTHNDYSYGNAPSAFMNKAGVTGGMRRMLTQFMRYPQHVYAMMVQATADGLHGQSQEIKRQGWKTLGGMLATHLAVAGALGSMIQPVKFAIGMTAWAASATGATDEPFNFANAFTGAAYDRLVREATNDVFGSDIGKVVAGGLPRLFGVDLSQRLSLGTLYFTHMRTDSNESVIGSLVESFGGPWVSQMVQVADGMGELSQGNVAKAMELISPHVTRDLISAYEASDKGLVTNRGDTLIPAQNLSAGQLFAEAIGLRPAAIADAQSRKAVMDDVRGQLMDRSKGLRSEWIQADPTDRPKVMEQIRAFNRANPAFGITWSSLRKGEIAEMEGNRQIAVFGAKIRSTRQAQELEHYGDPYHALESSRR